MNSSLNSDNFLDRLQNRGESFQQREADRLGNILNTYTGSITLLYHQTCIDSASYIQLNLQNGG